ncbi:MarR family winged helix-turn-helix transcriptional regulator [Tautonia plasticadhaerens]|uniref:HTH-type transcriptional repressor NicR n=1 Tax=Tautonia plasticadhaerens TaxID=2527974 RepID=A0A518H302_9BACT|nr:MarR family winged helix-turn-helix transcriptional regulator [Tautonia plasticadhaerens]QDV35216.1 HTH-type transcriptional repressor NicR [Tautonia plasticadhaerens]
MQADHPEEVTSPDGPPIDPRQGPARERFGFLMAMAAHRFRARFEEELEPMGVQLKHVAVLATIDHFGPVAQRRLGESVCIDRASMVGLLDEMEQRGLVRRRDDPADRRAHLVHLTDEGKDLLRRANGMVEGVEAECLGPLSPAERGTLKDMLQRIVDPGSWSGFEHINIKVSGRAAGGAELAAPPPPSGRVESSPGGGGGRSR